MFCNVSMNPSLVRNVPEDGHMGGRNMYEVYGR
jgi:hypothetical protein